MRIVMLLKETVKILHPARYIIVAIMVVGFANFYGCGVKRHTLSTGDINKLARDGRDNIDKLYYVSHPDQSYDNQSGRTIQLNAELWTIENRLMSGSNIEGIVIKYHILFHDRPVAFTTIDKENIYIDSLLIDRDSPYRHNDNQLAAVIAHELAHIMKNHAVKLASERTLRYEIYVEAKYTIEPVNWTGVTAMATQGITKIFFNNYYEKNKDKIEKSMRTNDINYGTRNSDMSSFSITPKEFLNITIHGYSIADEMEADKIALSFLKEAGYNPVAMASVLELQLRFLKDRGGSYLNYLQIENYRYNLQKRLDNVNEILKSKKYAWRIQDETHNI
jgi:hypothetical protein